MNSEEKYLSYSDSDKCPEQKLIARSGVVWIIILAFIFFPTMNSISQELKGKVYEKNFIGSFTGDSVYYSIYLPENYGQTGSRYPVIYHLHGYGDTQFGGWQEVLVPASFESAKSAIGSVIIVCPNGYGTSYWTDCIDSTRHAESNIIDELVPHVDQSYLTIADRKHRIIQGFSMGGFGALKFIAKFPDVFSICVAYDGGPYFWATLKSWFPFTASDFFNMDEQRFNQNAPMPLAETNAKALKDKCHVRLVVGQETSGNRSMRDHYRNLGIPLDYVETLCSHDLPCLLGIEGGNSADFIAKNLASGTTDVDVSDTVTPKSFLLSQNFPNPFNASTTIRFFLPHPSHVTLKIFDMLGREMTAVVNSFMSAGEHTVRINAENWASGEYLYELKAEELKETRKMLVQK